MKKIIYWDKKYFEDIGESIDDDFYEYAYLYYDFWFNLPNNTAIRGRIYKPNLSKCTLHGIYEQQEEYEISAVWNKTQHIDNKFVTSNIYFRGIIEFLKKNENITEFYYINHKMIKINTEENYSSGIIFERKKLIK